MIIHLKRDPAAVELGEGFTGAVSALGHLGTGNLEVRATDPAPPEQVYAPTQRAYDNG